MEAERIFVTDVTYPESAVPAASAERHSIGAHSKAADTILVAREHSHPFSLQRIPDITSPIVITTKEYTARN